MNPFAGAGGRLGWKGTDWPLPLKLLEKVKDPYSLPAVIRAKRFLEALTNYPETRKTVFLSPPGIMGLDHIENTSMEFKKIEIECIERGKWPTTPEDTIRCLSKCLEEDPGIIVFVGGDGTARIVLDVVDGKLPLIGVPAGVKVYSAVFAESPEAAALLLAKYIRGMVRFEERSILDIDEDAFRKGELIVRKYGTAIVPVSSDLVVSGKVPSTRSAESELEDIAEYFADEIYEDCTVYILGPGSTVYKIASRLGIEKTLLGVDVMHNKKIIGKDVDEETLLKIIEKYSNHRFMIVVSPIGGQGFIFGRGNQQISPEVIRRIGKDNILIVSAPSKLNKLEKLRVDTGDPLIDRELRGYAKVLVGYGKYKVVKIG